MNEPRQNTSGQSAALYKPLPPDSTRLVRLCYEDDGQLPHPQLVTCQFTRAEDGRLLSNIPYLAVSYAWGDAKALRPCAIRNEDNEDCNIDITETLFECLTSLSRTVREGPKYELYVWVDQIVINQQDLVEKASQVRQMRWVYQAADELCIWLGDPPNALVETAMKLDDIQCSFLEHSDDLEAFYDGTLQEDGHEWLNRMMGGLLSDPLSDENKRIWDCVQQIFDSPWFSRAWILQEAGAVPRERTKFCWDGVALPLSLFNIFSIAIKYYIHRLWHRSSYRSPVRRFQRTDGTLGRIDILRHVNDNADNQRTLWDRLELLRRSSATDPRDKIFCMLELASDVKKGDPTLFVDYTVSMDVLLARLIRWHLMTHNSLDFLDHCSYNARNLARHDGLPSWIPDLVGDITSRHRQMSFGLPDRMPMYSASRSLPLPLLPKAECVPDKRLDFLKLSGAFVMEIKDIVLGDLNTFNLLYESNQSDNALSLTIHEHAVRRDWKKFWSLVVGGLRDRQQDLRPADADIDEIYTAVMTADQVETNQWSNTRCRTSHALKMAESDGCTPPIPADEVRRRVTHAVSRQEVPSGGTMGLFTCGSRGRRVPRWVGSCYAFRLKPGDEVWMLRGGCMLYVLRPLLLDTERRGTCLDLVDGQHGEMTLAKGDVVYGFVAKCYVHGLMDGELVEMMSGQASDEIEGMDRNFHNIIMV